MGKMKIKRILMSENLFNLITLEYRFPIFFIIEIRYFLYPYPVGKEIANSSKGYKNAVRWGCVIK